jgi:hypothetical protein
MLNALRQHRLFGLSLPHGDVLIGSHVPAAHVVGLAKVPRELRDAVSEMLKNIEEAVARAKQ